MKFYSVIIKKKPIQLATLSHGTIYLYRILQHDISALSFFYQRPSGVNHPWK